MIFGNQAFYTYCFGTMGRTLETAQQTGFFSWFHLVQTDQNVQEPGLVMRFRPSGENFPVIFAFSISSQMRAAAWFRWNSLCPAPSSTDATGSLPRIS